MFRKVLLETMSQTFMKSPNSFLLPEMELINLSCDQSVFHRRVARNAEKPFEKPCELSVSAVPILALPLVMSRWQPGLLNILNNYHQEMKMRIILWVSVDQAEVSHRIHNGKTQ